MMLPGIVWTTAGCSTQSGVKGDIVKQIREIKKKKSLKKKLQLSKDLNLGIILMTQERNRQCYRNTQENC